MATVRQTIALQDRVTPVLSSIMTAMRSTMTTMRAMNDAMSTPLAGSAFDEMRRDIENADEQLRRFQDHVDELGGAASGAAARASNSFSGWSLAVTGLNSAIQLTRTALDALQAPIRLADSFISTDARLRNINDGLRTQEELQQQVYASAQRSRGLYSETADAVAKLNLLAGNTFTNNDEAIAFAEIMNKAFTAAGAEQSEASAAMRQMTQALASGRLQGDEFVSIRENAPLIAQAIQDYMGVSAGAMRELSSEGKITADIIKNAVFNAGADIEALFQEMPMTFEQSMGRIQNAGLFALQPLIYAFSDFVNSTTFETWSQRAVTAIQWTVNGVDYLIDRGAALAAAPGFNQFVSYVGGGLMFIGNVAMWLGGTALNGVTWAIENWGTLEPIVTGLATAIGILAAAYLLYNGYKTVTNALEVAGVVAAYARAAATGATVAPTVAATAAQWGLNTALLASPVTWIILAIAALIAIMVALGLYIRKLWQTNIDFKVGVISIWNGILNFFDQVPIFFMGVGYGIADAFSYAKIMTLMILQSMANDALEIINGMIGLLNKIPGVAIDTIEPLTFAAAAAAEEEAARANRAASLADAKAGAAAKAAEREAQLNADAARWRAEAAANAEDNALPEIDTDIGNPNNSDFWNANGGYDYGNFLSDNDVLGNIDGGAVKTTSTGGKLDSVGEVGISDEDLKYLRDIAQAEYVNKYTTSRPVVYANFGDIHESADVNEVLAVLEDAVAGAYDSSLERD